MLIHHMQKNNFFHPYKQYQELEVNVNFITLCILLVIDYKYVLKGIANIFMHLRCWKDRDSLDIAYHMQIFVMTQLWRKFSLKIYSMNFICYNVFSDEGHRLIIALLFSNQLIVFRKYSKCCIVIWYMDAISNIMHQT